MLTLIEMKNMMSPDAMRDRVAMLHQKRRAERDPASKLNKHVELISIRLREGASVAELAKEMSCIHSTMKNFLVKNGLIKDKPKREVTADRIMAKHKKGKTVAIIAKELDMSPSTVYLRLKEAGAKPNKPKRPQHQQAQKITDDQLYSYAEERVPVAIIATLHDMSRQGVYLRMQKLGLVPYGSKKPKPSEKGRPD